MLQEVREFATAFGHKLDEFGISSKDLTLRYALNNEEFTELNKAVAALLYDLNVGKGATKQTLTEILKEAADVVYVVAGMCAYLGLDLEGAYKEVHRSNMSKLGSDGKPIYREDGKVLKGPNYSEANMESFI